MDDMIQMGNSRSLVDVAGNASESWLSPLLRVNSTEALFYPELMFLHGSPVQGNNTAGVAAAAEMPVENAPTADLEARQPIFTSFQFLIKCYNPLRYINV